MVLASLLGRDTATIARKVVSAQDSVGGQTYSYTAAGRGTLPTSWSCRVQQMSAREQRDHGIKGNNVGWKLLGHTRPQVDERDQITFVDSESVSHTIQVLGKERNGDNQGIMWQVNGEEDSTES